MSDPTNGFCVSDCRWVVFDAVGTLIHPNPSVAVAYHSIAARYGSRFGVTEIGDRFRQAFRKSETDVFPNGPGVEAPWFTNDEIELARWRWIIGEVVPDVEDLERCFGELWDHFSRPESWGCFDDVRSTLQTLRSAGFRLAIASNFDARLHRVCDGHIDLKPIERRFVSSEIGCRKPAPDFYSALITHCDCPSDQIVMIGDDPEHDVAGPIAKGMRAILIDRKSTKVDSNSIRSLRELRPHD